MQKAYKDLLLPVHEAFVPVWGGCRAHACDMFLLSCRGIADRCCWLPPTFHMQTANSTRSPKGAILKPIF